MPILLEEDRSFPLPKMFRVKQDFPADKVDEIEQTVINELNKPEVSSKIVSGSRVAVAVGSRGIRNLALIVKTVIDEIKSKGAEPFILSAMGSHGGGTKEGQRQVLESYGITPEAMGAPVVTDIEVECLGKTSKGLDVFFDRAALSADLIVPINRVKLHTDFVADIQSGLCKMLAIGLGNHRGCSALHEDDFETFGDTIIEASCMIIEKAPVGFGVAIVENSYDQTMIVEAITAEKFVEREKELVKIAAKNMPTLMIPEIDVLIVEEIGKNISGAGYDPNILGKSYILNKFVLDVPDIKKMVLLNISQESHGNAIGMGIFDVTTKAVFEQLDYESIYANAIAVKCVEDAKIPIVAEDEEEAVRVAIKILRNVDKNNLKIVKIKNTLALDNIEVSTALLNFVESHEKLSIIE